MSTLRERASVWLGETNTASMATVSLGRHRVAFISATHLWIYEEDWQPNPRTVVVNLTPKMRADLIAALTLKDEAA